MPTTKRLFKSHIANVNFMFANGRVATFQRGRYATDDEDEIKQLELEIKNKHPHIYVDDKEKEVKFEDDTLQQVNVRTEVVREALLERDQATNPYNEAGTYRDRLIPGNTEMATVSAGGQHPQLPVRTLNLSTGKPEKAVGEVTLNPVSTLPENQPKDEAAEKEQEAMKKAQEEVAENEAKKYQTEQSGQQDIRNEDVVMERRDAPILEKPLSDLSDPNAEVQKEQEQAKKSLTQILAEKRAQSTSTK